MKGSCIKAQPSHFVISAAPRGEGIFLCTLVARGGRDYEVGQLGLDAGALRHVRSTRAESQKSVGAAGAQQAHGALAMLGMVGCTAAHAGSATAPHWQPCIDSPTTLVLCCSTATAAMSSCTALPA